MSDHTLCRLGKWYYEDDGKHCFSQLPGYTEIEAPHIKGKRPIIPPTPTP